MESEALQPGDRIAETYEVKELLGTGGFARVYRAVEMRLGRDVALKVMSSESPGSDGDDDVATERFLREARHVSKLDSPHAVTLHDYDTLPDGRLYIVLEYVDGTTLDRVIEQQGGLSASRIRRILAQLLDVLAEAHDAGILHRDIKPSNVMLYDRRGREDCVKLLDFGIAKKVAWERTAGDDLTRDGQVLGTPRYMSPEQLQQVPLTPASDLFGVGLLVYEMWTGQSPYASADVTLIYERMREFDDRIEGLESAPEPLRTVGTRLLQPSPNDRIQSADTVRAMVEGRERDAAGEDEDSREHSSRGVSMSFPVGFDRTTDAPSSELTGVDLADESLTGAAADTVAGKALAEPTGDSGEQPVPPPNSSGESASTGPAASPPGTEQTPSEPDDAASHSRGRRRWVPVAVSTAAIAVAGGLALAVAVDFGGRSPPVDTHRDADGTASSPTDDVEAPSRRNVSDAGSEPVAADRANELQLSIEVAAEHLTTAVLRAQLRAERERKSDSEPSGPPPARPEPREEPSESDAPESSDESDEEPEPVPLEPLE